MTGRCGCSSMVELQLPKLIAWVRFPSPAPLHPLTCVADKTMRFLALPMVALMLAGPATVQAQPPPPVIDQLSSPFTDSELGGLGCLTATTVTAGTLVYLMGGFRRALLGMHGPLPPARVMEGTAAAAFIFSSACYVGAALAPVAMMAYTSVTDRLPNDLSSIISSGTSITGNSATGTSSSPAH